MKHHYINKRVLNELGALKDKGGVYCFWFKGFEDLVYIGSTSNFYKRFVTHLSLIRNNKSTPLINKILTGYMINGFKFKILEQTSNNYDLTNLEFIHIDKLKPKLNKIKTSLKYLYMQGKIDERGWTKKFTDLDVDQEFTADRVHYTTLNGTRQRLGFKFKDRVFTIRQSVKSKGDLVTVKRIA